MNLVSANKKENVKVHLHGAEATANFFLCECNLLFVCEDTVYLCLAKMSNILIKLKAYVCVPPNLL